MGRQYGQCGFYPDHGVFHGESLGELEEARTAADGDVFLCLVYRSGGIWGESSAAYAYEGHPRILARPVWWQLVRFLLYHLLAVHPVRESAPFASDERPVSGVFGLVLLMLFGTADIQDRDVLLECANPVLRLCLCHWRLSAAAWCIAADGGAA